MVFERRILAKNSDRRQTFCFVLTMTFITFQMFTSTIIHIVYINLNIAYDWIVYHNLSLLHTVIT